MRICLLVACLWTLLPRSSGAQATRVVADTGSYLLRITQKWGRESSLGSLPERRMGAQDVEVRLWQGYGLGGEWGTVLRREGGRWRGWYARVARCHYLVPIPVGDTLTPPSTARYQRLARSNCHDPNAGQADAPPGTNGWAVITVDTVAIVPLESVASLPGLWADLVRAGVTGLPTHVPREWIMLDGHSYVVEVRRGDEYRASVIEHTSPPPTRADSVVQSVAAIVGRLGRGPPPRAIEPRAIEPQATIGRTEARFVFPAEGSDRLAWPPAIPHAYPGMPARIWEVDWERAMDYERFGVDPHGIAVTAPWQRDSVRTMTFAELLAGIRPEVLTFCRSCGTPAAMPREDPAVSVSMNGRQVVVTVRGADAVRRIFPTVPDSVTLTRRDRSGEEERSIRLTVERRDPRR